MGNEIIKNKIEIIDILKGFAIILVIFAHSIIMFPINISEDVYWGKLLTFILTRLHMPVFFAISGFLCSFRGNYKQYFVKRIKRILVPYLIFNLGALFSRLIFKSFTHRGVTDFKEILSNLILKTDSSYWFLYTMFVLALISPLLIKLMKVKYGKLFLSLIGIIVMIISCTVKLPTIFSLINICNYLPFYIFGMLLKEKGFTLKNLKLSPVFLMICGVIYAIGFYFGFFYDINDVVFDYFQSFGGCILIAIIISKIKFPKFIKNRLLLSGKYSLQYYLMDAFLITGSRIFLINLLKIENPVIIVFGIFFITYILSELISKYIIDSNKLFRFVCGI